MSMHYFLKSVKCDNIYKLYLCVKLSLHSKLQLPIMFLHEIKTLHSKYTYICHKITKALF